MAKDPRLSLRLGKKSKLIVFAYAVLLVICIPLCLFPLFSELHYRKAYLFVNEASILNFKYLNRFKFAFQEYEKAIQYYPWENQYIMEYLKSLETYAKQTKDQNEKLNSYLTIQRLLDRLIFVDPHNPWYRSKKTTSSYELYKLTKENRYVSSSIEENRLAAFTDYENPIFLLNYASLLHQNRRYSEAFYYYNKSLTIDPIRFPDAHISIAEIYKKYGHDDKAFEHYFQAKDLNAKNRKLDSTILLYLLDQSMLSEASDYVQKHNLLSSNNRFTQAALALVYNAQGYYTTAIQLFETYFESSKRENKNISKEIRILYLDALLSNKERKKARQLAKDYYSKDKDPRYERFL